MSGGDPSDLLIKRAKPSLPDPSRPKRGDPFETPDRPARGRYETPRSPAPDTDDEYDGGDPVVAAVVGVAPADLRSGVFWNVARTLEVKVLSWYMGFTPAQATGPGGGLTIFQLMGSSVGGNYISGPASGTAVNQRVGNTIMLRRVHVRGTLLYDFWNAGGSPKGDELIRVCMFWNRQPMQGGSTSALATTAVFDQGAGQNGLLDDYFVSRTQSYVPVFDRTYRAVQFDEVGGTSQVVARIPFEIDLPVYQKVFFNASGVAVNFAPCMAVSSFHGTSYVQMKSYCYFSDC